MINFESPAFPDLNNFCNKQIINNNNKLVYEAMVSAQTCT